MSKFSKGIAIVWIHIGFTLLQDIKEKGNINTNTNKDRLTCKNSKKSIINLSIKKIKKQLYKE